MYGNSLSTKWHTRLKDLYLSCTLTNAPSFFLVKYIVVERDLINNTCEISHSVICPAAVKIENDRIIWHINDRDPLSDSLTIDCSMAEMKESDMLGYIMIEDKQSDSDYVSIGIITAFAVIRNFREKPNHTIAITFDDKTIRELPINAEPDELSNITKAINQNKHEFNADSVVIR